MTPAARVVLADDHRIFAEGLKRLLEPEFEVVRIVTDGRQLVEAVKELHPDIAVVDVSMPGLSGIQASRQILRDGGGVRIVILTMHEDVTYATTALDEGVSGYVLKHSDPSELLLAIREVLKGRVYVTPIIAKEVMDLMRRGRRPEGSKLTTRQREILELLVTGQTAKEIAAALGLSRKTVEYHKYRMMEGLGIDTTAELIQYAVKNRLVAP